MSEKVFLPTCSRCWMCVWRSPSRGSSGHSTCTWAPPCWSGSTPGSTSPPVRPGPTRSAAEAEAGGCSLLFGRDIWPADAELWPLTSPVRPASVKSIFGGLNLICQRPTATMTLHSVVWGYSCSVRSGQQPSVCCSRALMRVMNRDGLWLLHLNIPLGML